MSYRNAWNSLLVTINLTKEGVDDDRTKKLAEIYIKHSIRIYETLEEEYNHHGTELIKESFFDPEVERSDLGRLISRLEKNAEEYGIDIHKIRTELENEPKSSNK